MLSIIKNSLFNYKFQNVDNKLIRGKSIVNPIKLYELKRNGVTQIIDLRYLPEERIQTLPKYFEAFLCRLFNIQYKNYKYPHKKESLPNMEFFETINENILDNEGKTYIHCRHGRRRTGICTAIYELLYTNRAKKDILNELFTVGFKDLANKKKDLPPETHNRLTNIYNDFIEKFYPNEKFLK